jgi:hypothetical protein
VEGIHNFYFSSYFYAVNFFELNMTRASGNVPNELNLIAKKMAQEKAPVDTVTPHILY